MAGSLNHRWNTLFPDLVPISNKMEMLGFDILDGEVIEPGVSNV
jgi:hypothetical protein